MTQVHQFAPALNTGLNSLFNADFPRFVGVALITVASVESKVTSGSSPAR